MYAFLFLGKIDALSLKRSAMTYAAQAAEAGGFSEEDGTVKLRTLGSMRLPKCGPSTKHIDFQLELWEEGICVQVPKDDLLHQPHEDDGLQHDNC